MNRTILALDIHINTKNILQCIETTDSSVISTILGHIVDIIVIHYPPVQGDNNLPVMVPRLLSKWHNIDYVMNNALLDNLLRILHGLYLRLSNLPMDTVDCFFKYVSYDSDNKLLTLEMTKD